MKMKYDESDNALIRASRALTDRVTDFLGNAPPHSILNLEFLFSVKAFYLIVLTRPQILFFLFKKKKKSFFIPKPINLLISQEYY